MLKFELPFPPSVNNYKTIGKIVRTETGKLYQQRRNSNETKMYYFAVTQILRPYRRMAELDAIGETIGYEVIVGLHPPHQKRYDADNRLKVLLDSLVRAQVIKDDSLIKRLVVEKKPMVESGKVIVEIKAFTERVP